MSYETMAALSDDPVFRNRVLTCCTEQALIFKDDGRPDMAALADQILISQGNALPLFDLVCVAPGFTDATNQLAITDGEILSAVQAQWPTYAAVIYAPPPT